MHWIFKAGIVAGLGILGFSLFLSASLSRGTSTPKPVVLPAFREISRGQVEYFGIDDEGAISFPCTFIHYFCWASWQAQHVVVETDTGTRVDALEYIENTLNVTSLEPNETPDEKVNPLFNCHGHAMLKSQYWLNDPLPLLNDPRLYARIREADRAPGDIVTYWNPKGEIEHSAILDVRSPADARADKVLSKPGKGPDVDDPPRGPGPETAWDDPNVTVVYYRPLNP